jgi:uncharacterized protein
LTPEPIDERWRKLDIALLLVALPVSFGGPWLISVGWPDAPATVANGLFFWPHLVLPTMALALAARRGRPSVLLEARLPIRWRAVFGGVALSFALSFAYVLLVLVPVYLFVRKPVSESALLPPTDVSNASALAIAAFVAIGAPISEEIFFRGALFNGLAQFVGDRRSALASSFVFATVHLDLVRWPLLLGVGLLLCRTYRRSGTLYGSIVHHMLVNTPFTLGFLRWIL